MRHARPGLSAAAIWVGPGAAVKAVCTPCPRPAAAAGAQGALVCAAAPILRGMQVPFSRALPLVLALLYGRLRPAAGP